MRILMLLSLLLAATVHAHDFYPLEESVANFKPSDDSLERMFLDISRETIN